MDKKTLLGKIFISYSSKDKDFVRKLAKEIENHGYDVWLDEKELIAGNYLPKTIGKAIETSRVSIIVLSRYSISSKWVQHEVNHAISRMITGQMRLIPILTDDVALPPELSGLVFVDFRKPFEDGLAKVLIALDHEASKYDLREITKEPTSWELIEDILTRTFDSKGIGSILGEFKSMDYKTVALGETEIWYEVALAYGYKRPLNQQWWDEFSEVVSEWGVPYVLLITERPVGFDVVESLERAKGKLLLQELIPNVFSFDYKFLSTKVIIVDLSELDNPNDYTALIENAKEFISSLLAEGED